ncbi:MAG: SBBP repeat-containing protein [Bryobacteraceae bacterium]
MTRTLPILVILSHGAFGAGVSRSGVVSPFFWENRGQAPPQVRFIATAPRLTAYFSPGEAVFQVTGTRPLDVQFEGARACRPEAMGRLPGALNLLVGPEDRWRTGQPMYERVAYRNLYPGIDMIYGVAGRVLKSEFLVGPGADPSVIRVRYRGAGRLHIGEDGALAIPLGGGEEFREEAPTIYQERGGRRVAVEGRFVLAGETAGFAIGEYDASRPLIIDPAISYSTFLGGSGADAANAIAVDSTGAAYIAGFTESYNFPTANPAQNFNAGGDDVFVAKLDPAGTSLEYCTYIGGSADDRAYGIAVDAAGSVYITGATTSQDFPTRNPLQSKLAGSRNAFVLKLAPTGNSLVYSTYLGGNGSDSGSGIAVDADGSAYVAGDTTSLNFPAAAWQRWNHGGQDAFAVKLAADGSRLAWSTYLGGSNTDHAAGVAVDQTGAVWVTGSTWSADFPTVDAFQPASGGGQDAFVSKLSADGNTLLFSTYLGGSGGTFAYPEAAQAIALDAQGNAYVAGVTSSVDFPLLHPLQSSRGGAMDAFVVKVNASGTLAYSTYLGGSGVDVANAIAVDANGAAYVAGYTYSADLPVLNALQAAIGGDCDAFLARLGSAGTLDYLSYLGGNGSDTVTAVAAVAGSVYVAGWTLSTNFPLRSPYQSVDAGSYGAFVSELSFGSMPVVVGVTPSSGSGVSQTFSFQFSDSSGAADLTSASVLFNSTPGTANACAVLYGRASNTLSLLTDAGAQTGSITPGSGAQQNRQCILNGAGSSVSAAGTILTVNLALTFQPSMTGAMNIYMQASNPSASTGWQLKGSWTVPVTVAYSLTQIAPADAGALTAYLNSTSYIDFSALPDTDMTASNWRTYWTVGDASLTMSFFTVYQGVAYLQDAGKFTAPGPWFASPYDATVSPTGLSWNMWPQSQRTSDKTLPVLDHGAPYVIIALSRPVLTFGFEAEPPFSQSATITAVFQHNGSPDLSVSYGSLTSKGGSRIFAATGGGITGVAISTDDYYFLIGAFRYTLPGAAAAVIDTGAPAVHTPPAVTPSPAVVTSPANGSTLPGSTVTFQWSAGAGVSQYRLNLSRVAPVGSDLYGGSANPSTSATIANLPTDGGTIYARLFSQIGADWQYVDSSYKAAAPAPAAGAPALLSPASGSTLAVSTVMFQWSAASGASEYWLNLSKVAAGGTELFNGSVGTSVTKTLANLPTSGGSVYVRLWWKTGSTWRYLDYKFKAAGSP